MTRENVQVGGGTPLVVLGIPFHDVTFAQATSWCVRRMRSGRPGYVATANLDFVMQSRRDPELQRILLEADLVVADGAPLVWLSGLFGPKLRERVTGSDLTPMLAEACRDQGLGVFALGAAPGVAKKAMAVLEGRYPGLRVAGWHSPPQADLLEMDHADILKRISAAGPDLLLVAFGAPKQEKWINMHFREWNVPLAMGIGGTLDFLAGEQRRAPRWVQRLGMEWCWRMLTNPRRLLGRYASNLSFLAREAIRLSLLFRPERPGHNAAPSPGAEILERGQARLLSFQPLPSRFSVDEFLKRVLPLADTHSLVLDLGRIARLSSLELGALAVLDKACRARQGRLFLWNVGPKTGRFLAACGLGEHFGIVRSREELEKRLSALAAIVREGSMVTAPNGVLKVRLPLELTVSNLEDFRNRLDRAWESMAGAGGSGLYEVSMDAGGLEFLDSAALGYLAGIRRKADQQGVVLRLRGLHGAARRTVRLTRMEKLLLG